MCDHEYMKCSVVGDTGLPLHQPLSNNCKTAAQCTTNIHWIVRKPMRNLVLSRI